MVDPTDSIRRGMIAEINADPGSRMALEAEHGRVWSREELEADFEVIGFLAPFVTVKRLSDGATGSLKFQDSPRFYFGFEPK